MTQPHPQPIFNRTSFITLNGSRLFTAKDVCNLIREYCPECEKIRATHTPAPAPEESLPCLDELTEDDILLLNRCKEELHIRIAKERKDEREKVLDELLQWLDGHWTLTMIKHYGALTTQQSLEYKTTIKKIKSLRGGA